MKILLLFFRILRNIDNVLDLLRNYFRSKISRFRARRSKNYEAYTVYMLNNFCKAVAEIWKLQPKNNYAAGLIVEIVVFGIQLYQKTFSPDHGMVSIISRVQRCRFFPTCSDYAIESLRQYGLAYGTMLSLKRIAKCNPMCAGGYDPILKNSKS